MSIIVDNFAGGGGVSLGFDLGLGRSPDIAVNHDPEAIAMHEANHPRTLHLCGDVFDVNPRQVCGGKRVAAAWFSPDCKHFSKAKGRKPVSKRVRGLAWVAIRWAREVRPDVIFLENVEEFQDWGPLTKDNMPDPMKRGFTFRRWLGELKACGYQVEMRELRACDYGAPTSRKRLFIIARCDGQPIVWPAPTHGPGRAHPHRTAAECIDWSIPCPSIFERKKPLADKTLRRVARGIMRYVVNNARPFIVPVSHGGDDRVHGIDEPFRTVTGAHRGEFALAAPTLIQTGYGEREGQAPRTLDLDKPLGTVVAGGQKHALVAAFLARHYGGNENDGAQLTIPMHTVTTQDHHALVTASLGRERVPEVRAFITRFYGTGVGQNMELPLRTITAGGEHFGLVTVAGVQYEIADIGMRMLTPRELARAQGFPDSYVLDPMVDGKPLTKTAQVRMLGNSVCPQIAAALVRANVARELAEVA